MCLAGELLLITSECCTDLSWGGIRTLRRRRFMAKLWTALLIVASLLMLAPVIESGTSESTQFFQMIGTADSGGGG